MSRGTATRPGRSRTRHRGLLTVSIAVAIAAVASASMGAPPAARAASGAESATPPPATGYSTGMLFGTLGSMSDRAAAENAAGVEGATVELDWGAYEPAQGQFSARYTN